MTASAHRYGILIALHPVLLGAVAQGTWGEVHVTCHHSDEGEGDVIARHIRILLRPTGFLHTEHTFVVEDIRIGTVHTCRSEVAVIVYEEAILRTGLGEPLGHLHSRLVVTIQEVYLPSRDAHLGVFLTGLNEVFIEHVEDRPKHDAHTFCLAVVDESPQVDVSDGVHNVCLIRVIPSLIEHDVWNMVLGRKVNIILVRAGVDASLEIDSLQVPVVPPVPSHLAWTNPRGVTYLIRGGQRIHKVVHRHLRIILRDGHHSPWICPCSCALGDIVLCLFDIAHPTPRIIPHLLRIFRKGG